MIKTLNFLIVWVCMSVIILLKLLFWFWLLKPPISTYFPLSLILAPSIIIHTKLINRFPYKSEHKNILNVDIEAEEYKVIRERRNNKNDNKE
ncbi:hypothetical protein C1N27_07285 [Vibrio diazotrophicus]|nr:hypothetical protein C1N27_07285 [Vibrio diazotrophicus]